MRTAAILVAATMSLSGCIGTSALEPSAGQAEQFNYSKIEAQPLPALAAGVLPSNPAPETSAAPVRAVPAATAADKPSSYDEREDANLATAVRPTPDQTLGSVVASDGRRMNLPAPATLAVIDIAETRNALRTDDVRQ